MLTLKLKNSFEFQKIPKLSINSNIIKKGTRQTQQNFNQILYYSSNKGKRPARISNNSTKSISSQNIGKVIFRRFRIKRFKFFLLKNYLQKCKNCQESIISVNRKHSSIKRYKQLKQQDVSNRQYRKNINQFKLYFRHRR